MVVAHKLGPQNSDDCWYYSCRRERERENYTFAR